MRYRSRNACSAWWLSFHATCGLNNLGHLVCMFMQIFEYFLQFKRMLNRELNHFSESGKSSSQVSDYIFSTFMGEDHEPQKGAPNGVLIRCIQCLRVDTNIGCTKHCPVLPFAGTGEEWAQLQDCNYQTCTVHPIPDIGTTFVLAKMDHLSEKSIKAKNVLGETFSKKPYNRKITKKNIEAIEAIEAELGVIWMSS